MFSVKARHANKLGAGAESRSLTAVAPCLRDVTENRDSDSEALPTFIADSVSSYSFKSIPLCTQSVSRRVCCAAANEGIRRILLPRFSFPSDDPTCH
ncbi:hypothetical protein CEXT_449921 [Caerostris extrusa]|uniref:Uncharacterized protein n=1 Tax=Caerostris extrusa TaxID=172846 RepID=A0AAV4MP46_CAEEX|nr:hypothetical protein CEXT_449921 [Caerostris extrusa]